jgi:broad specificity phosphatase PhoE
MTLINFQNLSLNKQFMVKRIFLYRHGERSDLAPESRRLPHSIQYDPPLTHLGHRQAEAASDFLQSILSTSPSLKLVSSPMLRCVQTISYLSQKLNKPVHLQNAFGESFENDFGDIFAQLFIRHRQDEFPVACEKIEEVEYLRPGRTETLETTSERMGRVMQGYFEQVEEEVVVICTHLYVLWGFNLANGDPINKENYDPTQVAEYEYENKQFRHVRSGFSDFLEGLRG